MGAIQVETGLLHADHAKLTECVDDTESCLTSMHPAVQNMQEQIHTLQTEVKELRARDEDLEGRSCCNTVCFIGFPEGSGGPNMELFLEEWLTSTVLADRDPKLFSIERAHRIRE